MIMDMSKKKQKQTAGDNASQNQFENLNNCNITINDKEFVRAIATEVCSKEILNVYRMFTQDAIERSNKRDKLFAETFIPRIENIESAINSLKDPAFQFMIQDARETAVKTDRKEDWELLSDLLIYHIEKGQSKFIDAGIRRAIRIVNEIDLDALSALTVACALKYYSPKSSKFKEGLSVLNNLFGVLLYSKLPTGNEWLDHLDLLGAVRALPTIRLNKSREYLCSKYSEFVCVGIKKGTEECNEVIEILKANNIPCSVLIDNECLDGYMRLNIDNDTELSQEEKEIFLQIKNYYTKDNAAMQLACDNFIRMWDSLENLEKVRAWWDTIPHGFDISCLGRVLAQTNLKRIDSSLPDLI